MKTFEEKLKIIKGEREGNGNGRVDKFAGKIVVSTVHFYRSKYIDAKWHFKLKEIQKHLQKFKKNEHILTTLNLNWNDVEFKWNCEKNKHSSWNLNSIQTFKFLWKETWEI